MPTHTPVVQDVAPPAGTATPPPRVRSYAGAPLSDAVNALGLPVVPAPAPAPEPETSGPRTAGRDVPSSVPDYRTPTFVGRQGIFTGTGEVFAYEFLYRSGMYRRDAVDRWPASDQDLATAHVLAATFAPAGVWSLPAGVPAFVNFTRSFLVRDLPVPDAPDRLVLEVVESVEVDRDVVAGLCALADRGFRIAIDDFVAGEHQRILLPFAHYVKIDLRDIARDPSLVELARSHGATLVAEHVESADDAHRCHRLGIDLLQGNHLERTKVFKQPAVVETAGHR